MWALVHSDGEPVEEVLQAIGLSAQPEGQTVDWEAVIRDAGGPEKYRQRVARLLRSENEAVRGFGAIFLGVVGSPADAEKLVELLRATDLPVQEPLNAGYDGGRAAIGLGLLGAREHAGHLAPLLRSDRGALRGPAAMGLGYMGAGEHAAEIARLLEDPETAVIHNAMYALAELQAVEHAGDIARHLEVFPRSDTCQHAVYTLARLKSKDHAGEIAALLTDRFLKRGAAKSLALMDADEHAGDIAELLEDESSLVRQDAALSLGILGAEQYAGKVAGLLADPEGFVQTLAAWAIVLMEAEAYAPRALELLARSDESEAQLPWSPQGCEHIVIEELERVKERARESYRRLKMRFPGESETGKEGKASAAALKES
jgi:HEAT repeat protein